jgi:hypothetical protein
LKILFDQGVPVPLRDQLNGHNIYTTFELNWSSLSNGELISIAEQQGFDIFLTTDKNLKYQQNLSQRTIGIVVLSTTSWPRIQKCISKIQLVIDSISIGSYEEILIS